MNTRSAQERQLLLSLLPSRLIATRLSRVPSGSRLRYGPSTGWGRNLTRYRVAYRTEDEAI